MELRSNGTMLKGVRGNALGSGIVRVDDAGTAPRSHRGATQTARRAADSRIEVKLVVADRGDERWSFGVRHGVLHRSTFPWRNAPPSGPRGGCNPRGICGPGIGVDDARRVARTEWTFRSDRRGELPRLELVEPSVFSTSSNSASRSCFPNGILRSYKAIGLDRGVHVGASLDTLGDGKSQRKRCDHDLRTCVQKRFTSNAFVR